MIYEDFDLDDDDIGIYPLFAFTIEEIPENTEEISLNIGDLGVVTLDGSEFDYTVTDRKNFLGSAKHPVFKGFRTYYFKKIIKFNPTIPRQLVQAFRAHASQVDATKHEIREAVLAIARWME